MQNLRILEGVCYKIDSTIRQFIWEIIIAMGWIGKPSLFLHLVVVWAYALLDTSTSLF